jgi:hypothetical protein
MKTCRKLGISFWNYLGSRFGVENGWCPKVGRNC